MTTRAEGHRDALDCLLAEAPQLLNLGSGQGQSVLEVVQAIEAASNRSIPYTITERRPGDAPISVADPSQALARLGWRTQRSLEDICRDGWAWQQGIRWVTNLDQYKGKKPGNRPSITSMKVTSQGIPSCS